MRIAFASEPAYPDRPNEDFIGATADAVVLLDGASIPQASPRPARTACGGTPIPSAPPCSPR